MRHFEDFERELATRCDATTSLDGVVVSVLGWIVPKGVELTLREHGGRQEEHTADSDKYPFVVMMERAHESLFSLLGSQRLAGVGGLDGARCLADVRDIFGKIVAVVGKLHNAGLVHLDVKPRNILCNWKANGVVEPILCDLDAAAECGVQRPRTIKSGSEAYIPPETARALFCRGSEIKTDAPPPSPSNVVGDGRVESWRYSL
jgi:serine/threonine protein kinase